MLAVDVLAMTSRIKRGSGKRSRGADSEERSKPEKRARPSGERSTIVGTDPVPLKESVGMLAVMEGSPQLGGEVRIPMEMDR